MQREFKNQIKKILEVFGKHKLLLGIIQAGIVILLPMKILIPMFCPLNKPSFEMRIRAFFCQDIKWNVQEYPWSIFDFSDLKFVDNLQFVFIFWVIGIVSLLVKEMFRSQRLSLKLIALQGQVIFIGYGLGSILAQFLNIAIDDEICFAWVIRDQIYEVFTVYYSIAALIGTIIILSELKEIKEIKRNNEKNNQETMWVFSAIKVANFFGIIWLVITNIRFLEQFLMILRYKTSLPIGDYPYQDVIHVINLFFIINILFSFYFSKKAIEISSEVFSYLIYFLVTILGWTLLFVNIDTFTENYNFFHPSSRDQALILFISVIILFWFIPALSNYYAEKKLEKKEEINSTN